MTVEVSPNGPMIGSEIINTRIRRSAMTIVRRREMSIGSMRSDDPQFRRNPAARRALRTVTWKEERKRRYEEERPVMHAVHSPKWC